MTQPRLPSPPAALSPALAALLAEADRALRRLNLDDPHALYALLHQTACAIAPADAFYVCLYLPAHHILNFPYNIEDGLYDPPLWTGMGHGPTSQAIRQRRAVVWNTEAEAHTCGGIMFAYTNRFTHSAMHVPVFAPAGKGGAKGDLIGVLSMQAYAAGTYDAQAVDALHWLAERASTALVRAQDDAVWEWQLRLRAADAQGMDTSAPVSRLAAMTDEFVGLLHSLRCRVEDARRLLPPESDPALSEALAALAEAHCAAQTAASQLPLRPDLCPPPSAALRTLTPTERTVLQRLADGQRNKAVADALCISADTVKFHCKNIYHKLGVTTRTAAVRLWLNAYPNG